ncbi:E3 ubiquitin-protein ligase RNF4 [Chanos chanos]|uniref:E3 ubiquitin-protein ligase RNF4 n=1 Tax=Chanos chanos TaxID=29144 RepID=A0A6J2UMP0_CHACN|nr:E3 ubiquitin-protein ligase RNF4 [Chanos chanos]XP_030621632.1 E3 ubiquitin-protein ligase RNF4 [Chanos chanos]
MSTTTQRKRRRTSSSCSRCSTKRSRTQSSQRDMETIVLENDRLSNDEVVDLTCEGLEPAVVDLTNNDSVVVVGEDSQSRHGQNTESYVLSSDEEVDESSVGLSPAMLSSLQASTRARSMPGAVSCPVCMDAYAEIIDSGRLMVSTKCGHLFCSQCLRDSLARAHTCPTCRKKLTHKQYHPIYI